ncbi:MAG: ABC transporter ATP-binding protein [Candidatus Pacebacteria bacterium]|jgi:putative ABC transport system ATP-binding protein|nr:ABC transporter ATP-binding protein [Candidatus Paceibacterota bacterium]
MIKVRNLSKKFTNGENTTIALNDISFDVQEGEFLTITGRSGSGKSTLLYQLGLLDHPTSGEVYIDNFRVDNLSQNLRTQLRLNKLGYIFQDYAILPSLTALENVMVPLLMQGVSDKEAEKKSIEALNKIKLGHRINNLPSQMSGGEQQRVSIARAIAHSPKIIFADEPTANLDSETSNSVLEAFLELNKNGQTIIMVTHEQEYAVLGHRTLVLEDGKLKEDKVNKSHK